MDLSSSIPHPFLKRVQAPGRIDSAHQCAHRGPGDGGNLKPPFLQDLYRTYVGQASRSAAGQHQSDFPGFFHQLYFISRISIPSEKAALEPLTILNSVA